MEILKRILAAVVSVGLLAVLAACGGQAVNGSKSGLSPSAAQPQEGQAAAGTKPTVTKPTVTKLVIGFVPSVDAAKISGKVEPMSNFLTAELGIPVTTYVGTNYVNVIEAMGSDQVDLGFLNPLSYVLAYNEHKVKVVLKSVRKGETSYNAQIVVNAGSGIRNIDDLRGKRFAFGDAASTSSYLWPTHFFMKQFNLKSKEEIDKFFSKTQFVGSHDNVIKAVYNGDFDAGATFDDARTRVEKELKDVNQRVLVLTKIEGIPNDTISARRGLPQETIDRFKAAMMKFASTAEGKQVLFELYQIDGFAEAQPSDYQPVVDVANGTGLDVRSMLVKK